MGGILSVLHFGLIYRVTTLRGRKAFLHWAEMAMHLVVITAVVMAANAAGVLRHVLAVWLCPLLVFSILNSIRVIAEHDGTPYDAGQLSGTRTVTSNALVSYFWNNINWHIGHHVYPAVPWYNLQKLHALMLPQIQAQKAHVASSYVMVFLDALRTGPESEHTVSRRNPQWRATAVSDRHVTVGGDSGAR